MKKQLQLMLLLFGSTFIILMGCNKHEDLHATITGLYTNSTPIKGGLLNTGTFTTGGALSTSGTTVMNVQITGDSANCTNTFTAPEGTFFMVMHCSDINNTGHWNIPSGTGRFAELRGEGSLTMSFPPDVPAGVLGIEAMTGIVWKR